MAQVEGTTQVISEGSSSTPEDQTASANTLLANGKKNLACGDIVKAVDQLQEACSILSKAHGETDDKCAEAYLLYGTALLDLGRKENDVLGNALDGIEEKEDDDTTSTDSRVEDPEKVTGEEREKISNEVIDAMMDDRKGDKKEEENAVKNGKEEETPVDDAEAPKTNDETSDKTVEINGEKEETQDEEKKTDEEDEEEEEGDDEEVSEGVESQEENEAGEGTSKGPDAEEDDDVSNLQLAWEMLELAKSIISRRGDDVKNQLMLAECHSKLGEVGLETEQCDVAVEDFTQCMEIQKKHLEEDSRLIAQTQYEIGLANYQSQKYEESKKALTDASSTITKRIDRLEKVSDKMEVDEKAPASDTTKEISDLQDILQDIKGKIADAEDELVQQNKLKATLKESLGLGSELGSTQIGFGDAASSEQSSTAATALDINHLVRKKRKPEEAEENKDESKKPRQEPTTNGTAPSPSKLKDEEMREEKSTAA